MQHYDALTNSELNALINENIHNARDRELLHRRLSHSKKRNRQGSASSAGFSCCISCCMVSQNAVFWTQNSVIFHPPCNTIFLNLRQNVEFTTF